MEWLAKFYENKMVAFGIIGGVGGYISGKTKKSRMQNAMVGAGVGAGTGFFMDRQGDEMAGFYGAPAQITSGPVGPTRISGSNGGSSIPYVSANAGPGGSRRPRPGSYAYRRARADMLGPVDGFGGYGELEVMGGYGAAAPPAYRPVATPVAPYVPVSVPVAPYRPVTPPVARYRPIPGSHRSYYHRPHANYRVKHYCRKLQAAINAMELAMAENRPVHAYPGGPVMAPQQARDKLHRYKQVYAHWCTMLMGG